MQTWEEHNNLMFRRMHILYIRQNDTILKDMNDECNKKLDFFSPTLTQFDFFFIQYVLLFYS